MKGLRTGMINLHYSELTITPQRRYHRVSMTLARICMALAPSEWLGTSSLKEGIHKMFGSESIHIDERHTVDSSTAQRKQAAETFNAGMLFCGIILLAARLSF